MPITADLKYNEDFIRSLPQWYMDLFYPAAQQPSPGPMLKGLPQDEPYALGDQVFQDIPSWLMYLTKQWQKQQPSDQQRYLEGRRSDPIGGFEGFAYDTPLAYLTNMQEGLAWDDLGPTGPRWHGRSKTPGGQWLKRPWHPSHWREDQAMLQQLFDLARMS